MAHGGETPGPIDLEGKRAYILTDSPVEDVDEQWKPTPECNDRCYGEPCVHRKGGA